MLGDQLCLLSNHFKNHWYLFELTTFSIFLSLHTHHYYLCCFSFPSLLMRWMNYYLHFRSNSNLTSMKILRHPSPTTSPRQKWVPQASFLLTPIIPCTCCSTGLFDLLPWWGTPWDQGHIWFFSESSQFCVVPIPQQVLGSYLVHKYKLIFSPAVNTKQIQKEADSTVWREIT